ncbi:hypothetical protein V2H45_10660 [Tumidithrix elongata RA019]|uniref:DUF7933 domain-containing protein n=1 Tax=Tumidithrix elongata BACA0141 TaxID=2716417 RepID=A0AAW9Q2Y7_9CYAN|nr:hypothetical protein [Tumidithrix elongata RA019]
MSSWQFAIQTLFQWMSRFLNPPHRLQRLLQRVGIFCAVFLLVSTQNYWLLQPASAQVSTLLRVTNQFIPPSVAPGVTSILRIQINNDSGAPLTNLGLVNPLATVPGVLIIPAAPAITSTCGGATSSTPGSFPGTAGSVTLTGGTLAGGAFCIIDVPVRGFTSGNYIETIAAGSVTSATLSNADASSATLQILPQTAATINKAFNPNTIPGDGRSRVTLTINNTNPYALTGASLTDTLPANVTVDTRPGAIAPTTTCAGGTVNTLPALAGVSLSGGTIPANGSCTITFDATSTVGGTYTNTIPANALSTVNLISNSNPPSDNLNVQTQVTIAKAFGQANLDEERTTSLTISITNGGVALTSATLTDNLPSPLVVADTTASTTCTPTGTSQALTVTAGAGSFTLNNGNVAGGAAQIPGSNPATNVFGTCTVTVNVKPAGGTLGNLGGGPTLAVTNTIPANALGNAEGRTNAAPATANITARAGIIVTKTYTPNTNLIAPGSTSRVRIRVNNRSGVANATGVSYTDNLPAGLVVANPPNASVTAGCGGGTISPALVSGATSVTLTGASLSNAAVVCDVFFDVTTSSPVGTIFDNVIPNNSVTNAQGLDSDGVTGTEGRLSVISRVEIAKVFNPTTVGRGLPSQMTITLRNNRRSNLGVAEPLTNVAITDNLPTNLQVANPVALTNSCGGLITGATSGSTSFSLSGGSIAPISSCAISLNAIEINQTQGSFPTPITYNNTPSAFSNSEGEGATLPTAPLTVISPLSPSKAFQSPNIAANGISTAVITLTNTQVIPLTNATFNDTWVQANTIVANPPNVSTTCVGGNVTTTAGTRNVAVTGATIPPQIGGVAGICTVRFDVVMDGTGPATFVNTIGAGAITTAEGFSNPAAITATLTRVVSAVTLVKDTAPPNINVGQPSTLTVTITNPGAGINLTNAGFVDTMPAGMIVYSVPNATTTCTGGVVTTTPGSNTFTLTGASLNTGASCNVSLRVTLTVTGNRTNTLPIGIITSREGVSNTAAASASLSAGPALSVSKAFAPAGIPTNGRSTLTITITNGLAGALTGLTVTDPLPANVVVANPPNASTTCGTGTVTANTGATSVVLNGATLGTNSSCTIAVDVTATVAGAFLNTIPAGNVTADGGISNLQPASATLTAGPTVSLLKSFTPTNISPGGTSVLTIQIQNPTATALTGASLQDDYPAGVLTATTPAQSTTCGGTVTFGTTFVRLTGGTIPANGNCTISISVTANASGTYPNVIPAGALVTNSGTTNTLPASANLVVGNSPQVLLVKRITRINNTAQAGLIDDPSTTDDNNANWPGGYLQGQINVNNVLAGDRLEYTIYFLNAGLAAANNVRICDRVLPNQTYLPNAFTGLFPTDGGLAADLGMALAVSSTTPSVYLTTVNDPPDRGQFLAAPTPVPTNCGEGATPSANVNGVAVVDVTRNPDLPTIPFATGAGTPANSYGFVRFQTVVK